MCEYCKLELINKDLGERETDVSIMKMKDGSQTFEVELRRYSNETENIYRAYLALEYGISTPGGYVYSVEQKEIDIKYCPFCGEEL